MPIDPKKMQAFAAGPEPDEDDGPEAAEAGPEDKEDEGEGKFDELMPLLEEHAGEIEDAAMDLECNPQAVMAGEEVEEEVSDRLQEGYDALDQALTEGLSPLVDATPEDCEALAQHLHDEGMIDQLDEVGAWLWLVAQNMFGAGGEGGDEEGGEEDEELDEDGADDLGADSSIEG